MELKAKYLAPLAWLVLTSCASQMTPQQLYMSGKPLPFRNYKTGATLMQRQDATTDCQIEAARRVPQSIQIGTTPSYTTPIQTSCNRIGTQVFCNTTGGDTIGGNTYSYDANSGLRQSAYRQCIAHKGFLDLSIPACPKDQDVTILATPASTRLPKLGASSCYRADETGITLANLK
ncbi:hypothetical protein KM176_02855 [Pseudooceanicola sp. CBS1P-1]|uniref:Lipoprotein n=1 Tax=Pseudooceanicola albus TaxID=2692189 RepID=A0A6L7G068_9RHOB|nr:MULTISPECIES: hypothetical protein [Pseudooceanicola]MBT9382791.1 hypothetical protein [Pseudooceanicola endophyticus]MXN17329.1 hypothetical protein [Pseudooceanicola albus]